MILPINNVSDTLSGYQFSRTANLSYAKASDNAPVPPVKAVGKVNGNATPVPESGGTSAAGASSAAASANTSGAYSGASSLTNGVSLAAPLQLPPGSQRILLSGEGRLQLPAGGASPENAAAASIFPAESQSAGNNIDIPTMQNGVGGANNDKNAESIQPQECQTCENRKYQDGSDDPGVSFKNATHISPNNAATAVRSHESEHVLNERLDATMENREVVSQHVQIHTSVCPDCGRVYVSGGTTRTTTRGNSIPEAYQAGDSNEPEGKGVGGRLSAVA